MNEIVRGGQVWAVTEVNVWWWLHVDVKLFWFISGLFNAISIPSLSYGLWTSAIHVAILAFNVFVKLSSITEFEGKLPSWYIFKNMHVTVISHSFFHGIVEMGKAVFTSPVSLLDWFSLTKAVQQEGEQRWYIRLSVAWEVPWGNQILNKKNGLYLSTGAPWRC